ncbi:di-trans,poly-cis-decaprenylcistransferase [bacterium]|nr:di-trans,poly-cis-decaprenylcistransferase [bacterium]MBU1073497.1 di-trans,poly-cis-decaprenylcistransferase [bacterium]MBU1674312.1 di-trans,poly-cis-decaprenylcistransferase [bacterium]
MSSGTDNTDAAPLDGLRDEVKRRGGVPRHVAVIMDGNGRWARRRRLPRIAGHRAGRHAVRQTLEACGRLGVDYLTLYTFSQENWKRPQAEVGALWGFLEEALAAERDELARKNVRLVASGELDIIPERAREALASTIVALSGNTGLTLNLALAYGGRTEILRACAILARRVAAGELDPAAIDEDVFRSGLYAPDIPDPDLVIRTSGEYRLSNFLIWQTAYSEIYFTPVYWPDFGEKDLLEAIADFQGRERRFGDVNGEGGGEGEGGGRSIFDPARWKKMLKVRS